MKNSFAIDIRIANYISRKLANYVIGRKNKEKALADKAWKEKFGTSNHILHSLGNDITIKLYNDSFLSRLIYDGFETDEIDFLNGFLAAGDCFVDIGANVGLFSLYAAKKVGPAGTVISFEPSKVTYDRLLENIQLNNFNNVKPFKLGLSDKEAVLELNISENGFEAWNTFIQSADSKFSRKEEVLVKPFDKFLEENNIDIDKIALIKLDVEGFEINVLKGASKLLSRENAPVFMVEYTDANAVAAGHCCHEIYKLLNEYGYTWYTYDAASKKLIYDQMRISYPYNNLIAIKNTNSNKRVARFTIEKS